MSGSEPNEEKTKSETGDVPSQNPAELQNIHSAYRLNEKNYLKWSQLIKTILKGKGKVKHIMNAAPKEDDPNFTKWDEEDSRIMAWLWNSMDPDISDTCMFLSTAKEIGDAMEQSYSKAKDAAQVYEVKVKTLAAKQGNRTVTDYANQLKALWMELDHYRVIKTQCSADAATLKKFIEQDRVYDFLVGLNSEFDQVRIQILGKQEVPSFNEVIAIVRSEESRRSLMLDTPIIENSAMMADLNKGEETTMSVDRRKGESTNIERKGDDGTLCTYCHKPRHNRENCWKLHGKPQNRDKAWGHKGSFQRKGGQTHMAAAGTSEGNKSAESVYFNQEEIEKMKIFLSKLEKPAGSSSLAYSGKGSSSLAYSGKLLSLNYDKFPISFGLNVSNTPSNRCWILDSGATDHMTPLARHFSTYSPCPSNKKIATADGTLITVAGQGDVQINHSMTLKNVLHIPKLAINLISIQKLTQDLSCNVIFHNLDCVLQDKISGRTIGHAREWNGLYYLEEPDLSSKKDLPHSLVSVLTNKEKILLYHCRLGHPSFEIIKMLFPSFFSKLDVESLHCEVCELAKHKRVSFPMSNKISTFPFYLVHTDVWGPSNVPNVSGAKWFVTFIDDCTRVTWVYLLKHKSEVSSIFLNFHSMIKNQFGANIKRLRSDNAKDYFNNVLNSFCQKEGIIHESSCVKTPQQNGVAERKNGHLLNQTRALLFQNNVPKSFWGEAVLTATHLINRLPTRVLKSKSPMDVLASFYPWMSTTNNLKPRIFGCVSYVHIHSTNRGKLDPRALKCVFVGYSSIQKGYKCYHPSSKKFFVSRDVTFNEHESYFNQPHLQGENLREDEVINFSLDLTFEPAGQSEQTTTHERVESETETSHSKQSRPEIDDVRYGKNLVYSRKLKAVPDTTQVQESTHNQDPNEVTISNSPSAFDLPNELTISMPPLASDLPNEPARTQNHDLPIAIRKKTRQCTKHPLYPLSNYLSFKNCSPAHRAFLTNLNTTSTPTTLSEAFSDRKWKLAMDLEMEALEKNNTWELVILPTGKKPVGCKWVFTIKYKADGSIERYKARLVAKGFTQTYGVDYLETFAPVAKMNTVRVILSLAANYGWDLQQFDVKNAFLHGELEEEIYMELPPGYGGKGAANTVCKLKKALYGLKQSPRAWFGRFTKVMTGLGYKQSQGDHTLFIKHSKSEGLTVLLVYVDDIILTGNDVEEQKMLGQCLANEFEIKTLGRLKYFLGIEVAHSKKGIFISQQKYITDLLKETGKSACKPASTPLDPNLKLGIAEEAAAVDKEMYQRLVGRLIYLSHTRPDIAYAVSLVSQFMHNPKENHLQAALRVVQYLKGTPGRGIIFNRNGNVSLEAYTDADYAGSVVDRRSTTGYCTFLGGNLVTWKSKKQSVVARSSAEAEFRAMAQGICELLWLKIILEDLKIKWEEPMKLYCDNKSAISIAHNPVQHDRTKHIEVDRHFIKEKLDSGLICTPFVSSQNQLADVLTKGLNSHNFERIVSKLGMDNTYSPA
ncbi:putative mitochondrial protein [Trifolium repens]|nr:putative mitochondrial protein [Trifolium repens]